MSEYRDIDYVPETLQNQVNWLGDDAYGNRYRTIYLGLLLFELLAVTGIFFAVSGAHWQVATKVAIVLNIIICLLHVIYRFSYKPINYLAPDLIYLAFYFLFHLGYLILWFLKIVPTVDFVFQHEDLFPKTMLIVNIGLLGFLLGYEIAAANRFRRGPVQMMRLSTPMWSFAGVCLMVFALAIHFGYILKVGVGEFLLRGYYVSAFMKRYVGDTRLWELQSRFFALGFAIYIISVALNYKRLFKGKLGITLFIIYMFLLIMEGSRTPMVIVGMILIIVHHYLIKPIKLKWLILFGVLAMAMFGAIGIVRSVTAFDISKMISELQYTRQAGQIHWYDPLVEMGGTVRTINLTTALVPGEQPYWYGKSYVMSITHIVPYLQGLLARFLGPSTAVWLTWTLYGPGAAGTGFSIAGEGYLNFGIIGVFFHMILIGVLLRRIYVWFSSVISPSHSLLFFVAVGIFLVNVRGDTNLMFAPLANLVVLGWLLNVICGEQELTYEENMQAMEYDFYDISA